MKLPKALKGKTRCDLAQLSIFTDNLLIAMKVADKVSKDKKSKKSGYKIINRSRVYYCLKGLVNEESIYSPK